MASHNQKYMAVFVDPDDDKTLFWWPALVIPKSELSQVVKAVGIRKPGQGQVLVCYFEDGSFSVVQETDVVPFSPFSKPYTSYLELYSTKFTMDKAVALATNYYNTGSIPSHFTWLKQPKKRTIQKSDKIAQEPSPISLNSIPSPDVLSSGESDVSDGQKVPGLKPMSKKRRWMLMYEQDLQKR